MARVQVGYDPRAEALQTVAAPNIQTEQARFDPNANKAVQLAAAFASPNAQQGIENLRQRMQQQEAHRADAEARAMPNSELEQKIKDGVILGVQSPVRVAAMRHVYGENLASNLEMDVLSKAQRGEYATWEDAQKDLQDKRVAALKNQDEYTVAGFSKSMPSVVNRLQALTLHSMNQRATEFAEAQANQKMRTTLETAGDGPEAAAALGNTYRDLVDKKMLTTPAQRSTALNSSLAAITKTGRVELLDGFLKQKLDGGMTVEDVIGSGVAAQYRHNAEQAFAQKLKAEGQARIQAMAEESHARAASAVNLAVGSGTFARNKDAITNAQIIDPKTGQPSKLGETKAGELADDAIRAQVEQNKIPMPQQVMLWATNNRLNPDWSNKVQAFNLASLGWESKDKKQGTLNPQSKEAIATYLEIAKTSPEQADAYAGSENAKTLRRIKFNMEHGSPDIDQAAALVYEGNHSGVRSEDYSIKKAAADKVVDAVVNPHFWSPTYRWASGLWGGNKDINLTPIRADVQEMVGDLVRSGKVEPEKAVEQVMTYLSNPAVTSVINNTVYYNKDLPQTPDGQDRGEWMTKFIKQKVAKDYGGELSSPPKFSNLANPLAVAEDVMRLGGGLAPVEEKPEDKVSRIGSQMRLAPNAYGGYDAWIGGVPAVNDKGERLVYSKKEIEGWINTGFEEEQKNVNTKRNAELSYEGWRTRVLKEYTDANDAKEQPSLPGAGASVMRYATSKGAYERLKKANMLDKPYNEVVDFMSTKGK